MTKGPLSRIFSHLTYGIEPFKKTMRMYSTEDGQGDLQCSLVGGKVSLNADIQVLPRNYRSLRCFRLYFVYDYMFYLRRE